MHHSKLTPDLAQSAIEAGLATEFDGRGGTWIGMHPELGSAYVCALTERIAIENRLHPVTDQTLPHTALSGWGLERLVQVLLDEPLSLGEPEPKPDLLDAFVCLAFETVVPADIENVPIDKIIEIRTSFGTELDAYRQFVADQATRLAELSDVRDLPVFEEHLRTEVRHTVSTRLTELDERLRGVGVETARGLASVKSVALPPLAATAGELVGLSPTIAGSAVLAACVMSAPARWRRGRRAAIRGSPVGYLFRLQRAATPGTVIDWLRAAWPAGRRRTGHPGP